MEPKEEQILDICSLVAKHTTPHVALYLLNVYIVTSYMYSEVI